MFSSNAGLPKSPGSTPQRPSTVPGRIARMARCLRAHVESEVGIETVVHTRAATRNCRMLSDLLGAAAGPVSGTCAMGTGTLRRWSLPDATAVSTSTRSAHESWSPLTEVSTRGKNRFGKPTSSLGGRVNPAAATRSASSNGWRGQSTRAEFAITQPVVDLDQLDSSSPTVEHFRIPTSRGSGRSCRSGMPNFLATSARVHRAQAVRRPDAERATREEAALAEGVATAGNAHGP